MKQLFFNVMPCKLKTEFVSTCIQLGYLLQVHIEFDITTCAAFWTAEHLTYYILYN